MAVAGIAAQGGLAVPAESTMHRDGLPDRWISDATISEESTRTPISCAASGGCSQGGAVYVLVRLSRKVARDGGFVSLGAADWQRRDAAEATCGLHVDADCTCTCACYVHVGVAVTGPSPSLYARATRHLVGIHRAPRSGSA
eukprot:6439956-Prymnesium_polylepis.1